MIIEQTWIANAYFHFNDLIACEDTGEALSIDAHEQLDPAGVKTVSSTSRGLRNAC
jgi:hypothetical protein